MRKKLMKLSEAEVGIRYLVIRGSLQTLFKGDHIALESNGTISCKEASGWLSPEDMPGKDFAYIKNRTLIKVDKEYYRQKQKELYAEIRRTTGIINNGE
jgi:hypothetical protein